MTALIYTGRLPTGVNSHQKRLGRALGAGLEQCPAPAVFFRADDIGVPGATVFRMMDLFLAFRVPLCLAVVPAWLTRTRWEALAGRADRAGSLFCWHQHGWRHSNHETHGKNQEFGPGRPLEAVRQDLDRGWDRLGEILGPRFSPFFTPPWNRCSDMTLSLLAAGNYQGVSRSSGSLPPAPEHLREINVNVDLHTRKDSSPDQGWESLYSELASGMASGLCGIMLHHNRMNGPAFIFLEFLLRQIVEYKTLRFITFDNSYRAG